jgi:hypothetical protein
MQQVLPLEPRQPALDTAPSLYFVRHAARAVLVRVEPTGGVRVTIPRGDQARSRFVTRQRG